MTNYKLLANAVRILAADSVEQAKSGHPGAPMGMAEMGTVLWLDHMQHNPLNPQWINRDRFVLSNGHASMLLYSLLHLTGYDLTITDLQNFRQLHSRTPGHPEYGYTPGVETTTGPLGQGLANAVGMALSEKLLADTFNQENYPLIDHYTYAFVGDGCLMEGISHEVCSFAGTLGLGKLIVLYDDNGISIDGEVADWYTDNVAQRFESYNWQVINAVDGHNVAQINTALEQAKLEKTKPSLIICRTTIGRGSPNKAGTEECHGAPLGKDELQRVRDELGWGYAPFIIPAEVYAEFDGTARGVKAEESWNQLFSNYKLAYPELAAELLRRVAHVMPKNWDQIIIAGINLAQQQQEKLATRKASQNAIEYFAQYLPELVGGSADLTGSNLTCWSTAQTLSHQNKFRGNYISYGVREFGMSAMLNGMFLHGGIRPFAGTFLTFADYAKNALRMASIMKIAPIFVYTHDSIGLGEDGPTHQPIEQLAQLRLSPNLEVWRPCDGVETMAAWGSALSNHTTPSCLVFSRQTLPCMQRNQQQLQDIRRGAYVLLNGNDNPDFLLLATGSEVEIAVNLAFKLQELGKTIRVVSMPSTTVFDRQDKAYQAQVLGGAKQIVAIEAGVADSWYKYVGTNGIIIAMDTFGESAPAAQLFKHFGFTVEVILAKLL